LPIKEGEKEVILYIQIIKTKRMQKMKKRTIFSFLKSTLWQVTVSIIAAIITTIIIALFFRQQILDFVFHIMNRSIPLWQAIIGCMVIVFLILLVIEIYNRKNNRKKKSVIRNRSGWAYPVIRVRTGNEQEKPFECYGLKWIAYIPRDCTDEYVWLEGPFCPECTSKLTGGWKKLFLWKGRKYRWLCEACNKEFELEYSIREVVEKRCYAKFFTQKKFSQNRHPKT
jgi:uncharacterized membrane protein